MTKTAMGSIIPIGICAWCAHCAWAHPAIDIERPADDHYTGQKRWTAATSKIRHAAQGHVVREPDHAVIIIRTHAQSVTVNEGR
jgi:hypothetical protein